MPDKNCKNCDNRYEDCGNIPTKYDDDTESCSHWTPEDCDTCPESKDCEEDLRFCPHNWQKEKPTRETELHGSFWIGYNAPYETYHTFMLVEDGLQQIDDPSNPYTLEDMVSEEELKEWEWLEFCKHPKDRRA